MRHASQWPYVATVQTTSFCKSVNVVVQFGVFRAVVAVSFFALSVLSPFSCLTSCASLNSLSLPVQKGITSPLCLTSSYHGRNLALPKLLVLPINEMECFPMVVKNMSDKNGINT